VVLVQFEFNAFSVKFDPQATLFGCQWSAVNCLVLNWPITITTDY